MRGAVSAFYIMIVPWDTSKSITGQNMDREGKAIIIHEKHFSP